jgi:hypothetical protein
MTKIVQSIVHLREFSFLPISTLGRRAGVAGCSLLNLLGNKGAQRWRENLLYQRLKKMPTAQRFFLGRNLAPQDVITCAKSLRMRGGTA